MLEDVVKDMVATVKQSIDAAIKAQAFDDKLKALQEKIDALPKGISLDEVKELIKSEIPEPQKIEPPVIDEEVIKALVAEEVAKIPLPKDGEKGEAGESIKGEKGDSVTIEDVMPVVKEAVDNAVSLIPKPKDGENGANGENGLDGKDALEIDIAPHINPEKSYPKGVYASHKGGLWKSVRKTNGMDGWEIIIDGVHEVKTVSMGERDFCVITEKSSGETRKENFHIPSMIYKDVYREGTEYLEGDTVTFGGSLWVAKSDTTEKPGVSEHWKLAVKRGRDSRGKI